ncbi:MAG: hypothetical protein QG597_4074 [Actinomycetota bacterium]|nr:hypothetical protein [Actinomycetota bacterium]
MVEQVWSRRPAADEDLALRLPGQGMRSRAREIHEALDARRGGLKRRRQEPYPEEWPWTRAAEGEEFVGAVLTGLQPAGWQVLHGVPLDGEGAAIDHLLIGPGGVFSLDTKARAGAHIWVGSRAIKVDGEEKEYLWIARQQARHATKVLRFATGLPIEVRPVLVFVGGPEAALERVGQPREVLVLNEFELLGTFAGAPRIYDPPQVAAIFASARRGGSWFPAATAVELPPPSA